MLNKIKQVLQSNGIELNFVPDLPQQLEKLFEDRPKKDDFQELYYAVHKPGTPGRPKNFVGQKTNGVEPIKFFDVEKFPEIAITHESPPCQNFHKETAVLKMNDNTALVRIKEEFFADMQKIKPCPVCGQKAKEYTRTIDNSLAWSLIALYKADKASPEQEYHHVNQLIKSFSSSGMAKLRFWGLVEGKINEDRKKKESGLYKITKTGKEFAEQKITVQKYVTTYNNAVLGFFSINIIDAVGTKFNYEELMSK